MKQYEWAIGYLDDKGEVADYHYLADIRTFTPKPDEPVSIELWVSDWGIWDGNDWDDLQDRFYLAVDQTDYILDDYCPINHCKVEIPKKYLAQFRAWRILRLKEANRLLLAYKTKEGKRHAFLPDEYKTACGLEVTKEWEVSTNPLKIQQTVVLAGVEVNSCSRCVKALQVW